MGEFRVTNEGFDPGIEGVPFVFQGAATCAFPVLGNASDQEFLVGEFEVALKVERVGMRGVLQNGQLFLHGCTSHLDVSNALIPQTRQDVVFDQLLEIGELVSGHGRDDREVRQIYRAGTALPEFGRKAVSDELANVVLTGLGVL